MYFRDGFCKTDAPHFCSPLVKSKGLFGAIKIIFTKRDVRSAHLRGPFSQDKNDDLTSGMLVSCNMMHRCKNSMTIILNNQHLVKG